MIVDYILRALWYILPAYAANAAPVVLHGRTPIDGNVKFLDGKPILGKGKTRKGFVFAILVGTLVGALQGVYTNLMAPHVLLGFALSVGAMSGDVVGSFIKRRFDVKQGSAVPLLDQWGFVFGALAFAYVLRVGIPDYTIILTILVMTPFIHLGANFLAHRLRLKTVPW